MHLVAKYPGYILYGVNVVTLPCMKSTWGGGGSNMLKNTSEISENQGFANFNIFFPCSNLFFSSNDYVHFVARYPV